MLLLGGMFSCLHNFYNGFGVLKNVLLTGAFHNNSIMIKYYCTICVVSYGLIFMASLYLNLLCLNFM